MAPDIAAVVIFCHPRMLLIMIKNYYYYDDDDYGDVAHHHHHLYQHQVGGCPEKCCHEVTNTVQSSGRNAFTASSISLHCGKHGQTSISKLYITVYSNCIQWYVTLPRIYTCSLKIVDDSPPTQSTPQCPCLHTAWGNNSATSSSSLLTLWL